MTVCIEGNFTPLLIVFPDKGRHQFHGNPRTHQSMYPIINPVKTILHPTHRLIGLVAHSIERDFHLSWRIFLQKLEHRLGEKGGIGL